MTDLIARALEPLLRVLFPPRGRRRRSPAPPPPPCPYCRDGVNGAVASRPEERPLRGEDNRLVRPYLSAGASA
ncbi:hypothetical protein [Streptomyces djakartensis]|uniref:Uncharacterized protein n=1 Tax=Streptomyces djakartensis TaxID=68193 RepID=A0ABQ2ZMI9_9ACTN|nr:hypothetical protein [Streptomyces djakartensis]GGY17926.1 hypothetical protein GCM10010384_25160 [Streptomyces djakartensis]